MFRTVALIVVGALSTGTAQAQSYVPAARRSAEPREFIVRIENVSTPSTLKLSNGNTAPAPTAPVLWVVHTRNNPVFSLGQVDRGLGLEALAETGNPAILAGALQGANGIVSVGAVDTPLGDDMPGPITPGKAYEVRFSAAAGQRLTLAMMFGQSNDLFYAPKGKGIELFQENGRPVQGDITSQFVLWDAGTEVNQEPGLGADQAPRQKSADAGTPERKPITVVRDRYTYPKTGEVIRVTLTAVSDDQT